MNKLGKRRPKTKKRRDRATCFSTRPLVSVFLIALMSLGLLPFAFSHCLAPFPVYLMYHFTCSPPRLALIFLTPSSLFSSGQVQREGSIATGETCTIKTGRRGGAKAD